MGAECMDGYVGVWAYVCMSYRSMNMCVCMCVCGWMDGCMGAYMDVGVWICECMGVWPHGLCVCGDMGV